VQVQGKIQKWVDHSISVTVNLPENTTKELVDKLYREAWKAGCKGMTIYRKNSRPPILEDSKPKNNSQKDIDTQCICFPINQILKRPKELDCEILRFQNNKEKWIAFVGLRDNRPYEIFTGLADDEDGILVPKWVEKGKIIKETDDEESNRYDFQFINRYGYKTTIEGLSHKFNKEFWNYAKLLSGVLRYGMPIDQVIKLIQGLQFDNDNINTWKAGVERALRKYTGITPEALTCPKCKQHSIVVSEGCFHCTNCDWAKCG
jgi:ribonucleoside-diphosphate reductase alpha chain